MKWGMPGMTRSRYFFNSSVIRQNLRQHGWIGIIYTLGLLFSLPLQLFMRSYPGAEPQEIDTLFQVGGDLQMLFIISLPAAAGLFLFRYLQSRRASDLWHSLPLRREHLLTAHLASGLGLLLLPVWLTAAVTAMVTPMDGNMYIYQGTDIWNWCLAVSILTLFLFVFSIFVGICTGQTVIQGIIIYILLILPAALIEFVNHHLSMYLYGYPEWFGLSEDRLIWSPLLHLIVLGEEPFSTGELWTYSGLSLLFIVFSYILYRKRSVEKSGQAIAFTYFNPLFKAGVMLCAMLLAGTYFGAVKPHQAGWVLCSHLAGALLGYIAAEMVIRKTWQIMTRKVPLEFAVYGVLLGLLVYIPVSGLTGYEDRVPAAEHITGVYAGSNYRMYNDDSYNGFASSEVAKDSSGNRVPFAGGQQYIEAVRSLHQTLITVRPDYNIAPSEEYNRGGRMFTLAYRLDNGRMVVREYRIPAKGFEPEMKAVMENEDFKRAEYDVQALDAEIESFRLSYRERVVRITDPEDVREFKDILIREKLNMSYEDQNEGQLPIAYIQPIQKPADEEGGSGRVNASVTRNYEWLPSYKKLGNWMEEKGFAEKIRSTAKDVQSAEIIKDDYKGRISPGETYNLELHMSLARQQKLSVVTRDKKVIAGILEHQREYLGKNGMYAAKLEYTDGDTQYVSIDMEGLEPALKSLLP
ncbi:DUF6449 domain-containing protein [Paenibacillus graminis]|nr:DUF6449 domain-containing protein [Paenibacillus graminis]